MDKIAKLSNKELEELFRNTAKKMKRPPAINEKDFIEKSRRFQK